MHLQQKQVTTAPHGHVLTNAAVWSPDGKRLVYDVRSDAAGDRFDGTRIETVDVETGEVKILYESHNGAHCGVATYHPAENKVAFILGPEHPTADWQYGPAHRGGVVVDESAPQVARPLDARDLTPPFTPGALRGGSHVHVFSPDGRMVSFTYEDHILQAHIEESRGQEINLRNVGVSVTGRPVIVPKDHARNRDGDCFSVLVTRTTAHPRPGSDEIKRAFEEGWVGANGYLRPDGTRQKKALAFQGHVVASNGNTHSEVFIVDLPDDLTVPGDRLLEGTAAQRPWPPAGTVQRRLTFTRDRQYPGLQGPRHWLRSSPNGSAIAFLMRDDAGVVQLWTVSPNGRPPHQVSRNQLPIASAFTWSPDGRRIAHVMDGSVCATDVASGDTLRLTQRCDPSPRPEACVFSPYGDRIAYCRQVPIGAGTFNQIFVCDC
jgi:hypothetical protein